MKTISLSEPEEAALMEIIDVAVRSAGLKIAGNAVVLAQKIATAPAASKEQNEPPRRKAG